MRLVGYKKAARRTRSPREYTLSRMPSPLYQAILELSTQKGNLSTPTGEQAPINTPEANSGTVSSTRVAQEQGNVNRVYKAKAPARIPSTDIGQHARCQESGMGRSQSGTKKSISPEKENVNGQRSRNRVGDIEGLSLRTSMDSITR